MTTTINSKGVIQKGLTKTIKTLNWDEIKEIGLTANPQLGRMNIYFYFSKKILDDFELIGIFDQKNRAEIIIQKYNKDIYEVIKHFYKGVIESERTRIN